MKHFYLLLAITGLLLVSQSSMAQFTITGEIRPRAEFRNGFKKPILESEDPAFFIEQRSRLYVDFKKEKIWLNVTIQDIRTWGGADQIYKSDPALTNVYEAWGQYNFTDKLALKVGRQAFNYDNSRFMGSLDWAQQGRSHDAALFMFDNQSGLKIHAAAAYNQDADIPEFRKLTDTYYHRNNYKAMEFFWLNKSFESGDFSFLIHNDGRQAVDSTMALRQTFAALGNFKAGTLTFGGELYYQTGKNQSKTSVSAYLIALYATLKTNIAPLTLGVDVLSGTDRDDNKDKSFDPLYGTNHKYYGAMDYFYVGNGHSNAGLIDIYFMAPIKTGAKSSIFINPHYFMAPVKVYNPNNPQDEMGRSLGVEIDLAYNLALTPDAKFSVGYSQMFHTETMEVIKNTAGEARGMQNWIYVMIAFKPTLFTTKKEE